MALVDSPQAQGQSCLNNNVFHANNKFLLGVRITVGITVITDGPVATGHTLLSITPIVGGREKLNT